MAGGGEVIHTHSLPYTTFLFLKKCMCDTVKLTLNVHCFAAFKAKNY